ncbi:MAG: glycine betaine/L-proline ABC transporter substrate-binding protein ProX [Okeania sp. SIO2G4]|uniref:glycine betaine/L-proline ABC transporter substrate-binding protein ProX n=1 Tax=unclassified Okeania TaxID=2634635 RepID=UPI0013BCCB0E|nr:MULTISPECIES: glycine betaine/L-proline ABC transporter substrate-binding protein ProX [unclassified Okeania]NEP05827.1 glycine betaine/L-proline ABC transporter substrate-binding protein ProX [Okeania sp. SIO4D6]NEP39260.1 glycine betaine/L-proline ABC transporter substrate-binding protein ProX [Okeania sp. SIO2H7]NEP75385.1 glycine betaine/L-proline ABC transporter substrate-binding protein ProX [Okeania sp. SIO2G5]NEP96481.1 glycine betaine/L-proline ABC transporter substrate-binding prot
MKRKRKKHCLKIVLAFLSISLIACQPTIQSNPESTDQTMPGKGVKVSSGSSITTYAAFLTEIINIGLEKLGYQTEPVKQLSVPVVHISVSNGELDFYTDHWEKLQNKFFIENGGEDKFKRVGIIVDNALQGYQIDKKTADKYKIISLEQLKDPKIAQLFDSDGDGKANLAGCNPGWGCELVIEHHLDVYGLRDTVEHDQGNYDILLADVVARNRLEKPILYYVYTPHWVPAVLEPGKDAIWLEVPFTSLPEEQGEVSEQETMLEGKNLGIAVDRVRIVANNKFLQANPAAKRLFELVSIPIEDVNGQQKLVQDGESNSKDLRRHAEEWVKKNQEQFDGWVEEARNTGTNLSEN